MSESKHIPVVSIDTAVPVPERTSYPLESLKVGESFLVPLAKRSSLQSRVSKVKLATGNEYTVKKMDNDNVRVWRTK